MLLQIDQIQVSYGTSQALFGVSLTVAAGEVVTLMGRNGMGKTTTVKAVAGLLGPHSGSIHFAGTRIDGLPPHKIARLGFGLVPEGRQVFPNLSVRENLVMAAIERDRSSGWTLEKVYAFFPRLAERQSHGGAQLSGGEQQMLAIGRALMTNPTLLVLDEATEGLAPLIRDEIWNRLCVLKETGISILVIDKELEALTGIADRHYILEKGEVVWTGTTSELVAQPLVHERYLGI